MKKLTVVVVLLVIVVISLVASRGYIVFRQSSQVLDQDQTQQSLVMMQWTQRAQTVSSASVTLDQAKQIAEQYRVSTQNTNLAIKEIMEFQYNFYITYYEKDTGRGAFEMLIWKQTPSQGVGMGTGMMVGVIMPEPGPNMMWNTKYSFGGGMMGQGTMHIAAQSTSLMAISKDKAGQLAQTYLDTNLKGATAEEDATQFYGYYTIDFTINGKTAGMLSVNGYTEQVWYHSWHGDFTQEVQFS